VRNSFFILCFFSFKLFGQSYDVLRALKEPEGAYYRADTSARVIYLNFTAHEFIEGLPYVARVLDSMKVPASFFLTGDFVRKEPGWVKRLHKGGHYVGAHSDKHLLYCDWTKRDSLLVSLPVIRKDLEDNIEELVRLGLKREGTRFFMPPYEWYNRAVFDLVTDMGYVMVNFSPGTSSNADYTTPDMKNYLSSDTIMQRILRYERTSDMNGFHLLIHVGTDPAREDKLYSRLPELIAYFRSRGYRFAQFQ
jgi:peptidoglycan/xylan/chitin deacetylase (PgdA/CDA1 family)